MMYEVSFHVGDLAISLGNHYKTHDEATKIMDSKYYIERDNPEGTFDYYSSNPSNVNSFYRITEIEEKTYLIAGGATISFTKNKTLTEQLLEYPQYSIEYLAGKKLQELEEGLKELCKKIT